VMDDHAYWHTRTTGGFDKLFLSAQEAHKRAGCIARPPWRRPSE
jgi:hypothetical protein